IISAIDEEISSVRGTTTEKGKLKVEALQTVKHVLVNQKNKPITPFDVAEKDLKKVVNLN
ncbi:MAG: hypothetical protein ACD_73C00083G0001, partial [uncultured bacterium]